MKMDGMCGSGSKPAPGWWGTKLAALIWSWLTSQYPLYRAPHCIFWFRSWLPNPLLPDSCHILITPAIPQASRTDNYCSWALLPFMLFHFGLWQIKGWEKQVVVQATLSRVWLAATSEWSWANLARLSCSRNEADDDHESGKIGQQHLRHSPAVGECRQKQAGHEALSLRVCPGTCSAESALEWLVA